MPTPARVTRSGREVKNSSTNQSKLDALELLARQRRGEKVDIGVKEDAPLFEEVNEEDYRRTRKGGFIADPESDEADSDLDFIDDDFEDDDLGDMIESSEKHRGRKKSNKKKDHDHDPRQRGIKGFLGGRTKTSAPSSSSTTAQVEVDQDEILANMLLDVPSKPTSSAQKPIRVSSRPPVIKPLALKTKANFDQMTTKRARMASPPPVDDLAGFDDWSNDTPNVTENNLASSNLNKMSNLQLSSQSSVIEESEPYEELPADDSGIVALPLNEDLKSNLEFHDMEDGRKYTRLYWYDCCEDPVKNPGVVYFFGRIYAASTKQFVSCCTIVKNIKRSVYLLIKEDSTYDQVVAEFTHIQAKRYKIKNFNCEKVTKKYAFSTGTKKIPLLADYVKIEYPASQPALPSDMIGETFSATLNVNQSPMERIVLDLKLRGPAWLQLIDPVAPNSQLTWSRIELILETPQNLLVDSNGAALQAPYFSTFSLSLRTYTNPNTNLNEIIAITGMVNSSFNLDQCLKRTNKATGHFCLMTKPAAGRKDLKLPYDFHVVAKRYRGTRFELFESERDLLVAFMEKFTNLDPDIVVGHDLLNFDYETLVMRMKIMKVGSWSRLGRFKRTELPQTKAAFRYLFSGRVMCDIRASAMELIKARSYDLTELTSQVLDKSRQEYNHASIVDSYRSSDSLMKLVHSTWEDVDNIFSILVELNIIPLALKITNITGNILSRTLSAGRSERNEYLLLHAFHEENFICPEKQLYAGRGGGFSKAGRAAGGGGGNQNQAESKELAPIRKKAAYTGGLVLEPKAGYYETCVLLMDFNSLYPSIIQEFNICFSTISVPDSTGVDDNTELIATVPDESVGTGVLPAQLKNLVDGRRRVKRLLADTKSPEQKLMLDIEQKALKLTANSMYGCLGFEQSRFYAKHLASLVTFKGREILMSTKAMVEKLNYEVIYGDTDSLMINTKISEYDEVIQKGNAIKGEINRTFKLLEIDIDGVYGPLLLLKKKMYAGASIKKLADGKLIKSIETKGLDTVRRDRAVIAKEAGERVLSMVLEGHKDIDQRVEDIHNFLKQLGDSVRSGQVPANKFLISKGLARNPDEYRDTKGIGHVTLALRYNSDNRRPRKLKAGDTVEFVICLDGSSESANQRAYTLEEMKERADELKLDYEYYLCQQIHPVMTRICDKLPVTNAYVLAEMLGVEKSSQLHIKREDTEGSRRDQLLSRGESRFNSCKPLVIQCPNCHLPDEIKARTRKNRDKKLELSMASCAQCGFRYAMRPDQMVVQVIGLIRRLTTELYSGKFICDNMECGYESRNVFAPLSSDVVVGHGESAAAAANVQPLCDQCGSSMFAEMDDRKMDGQLSFTKHLFDWRPDLGGNEPTSGSAAAAMLEPSEDVVSLYKRCAKEVDYALRCSFINNIDTYSLFQMICSGRDQQDHRGHSNELAGDNYKALTF